MNLMQIAADETLKYAREYWELDQIVVAYYFWIAHENLSAIVRMMERTERNLAETGFV